MYNAICSWWQVDEVHTFNSLESFRGAVLRFFKKCSHVYVCTLYVHTFVSLIFMNSSIYVLQCTELYYIAGVYLLDSFLYLVSLLDFLFYLKVVVVAIVIGFRNHVQIYLHIYMYGKMQNINILYLRLSCSQHYDCDATKMQYEIYYWL